MKPILFNTEMVRALLAGRKQVTRRAVKPRYRDGETGFRIVTNAHTGKYVRVEYFDEWENETRWMAEPYRPGDILYVRETWQYAYDLDGNEQPIEGTGRYLYAADNLPEPFGFWVNPDGTHRDSMPWRPSIHMPREAARIFLRVADVRVERLQDITEEQAEKEGCSAHGGNLALDEFEEVWHRTLRPADHGLYDWDANPWVLVIEFEQISREEANP